MKNIIYLLLPIIILSCTNSKKLSHNTNPNLYIADIDNASMQNRILFSDIFKEMQTIVLEASKEAIIGTINKIKVTNDMIFILDGKRPKSLKVFSLSGKFIREIGIWGRAPGEYTSLSDFTLDTVNKIIYTMDPTLQKIYKYDLNTGEFLGDYKLNGAKTARSYNIQYLNGKIYADMYFPDKLDNHYIIREIDLKNGKQTGEWLNVKEHNNGWFNQNIVETNVFYSTFGGTCKFVQKFMDTVMSINTNNITPYLVVKSKNIINTADLKNTQNNPSIPDPGIFTINKIHHINSYIETQENIFFKYKKGTTMTNVVYNKKQHSTKLVKSFRNNLLFSDKITNTWLPSFGCSTDNGIFYYVNTHKILDLRQYAEDEVLATGIDKLEELKQLTSDSNPVIFYCKYN